MNPDTLARFSKKELIALILAQAEVIARQTAHVEALTKQIDVLMKRVAALEAELGKPPKTPDNSSLPPSRGHKPNRAERRAGKKRKGHPGAFRQLSGTPDRVVEALAAACPHCDHVLCATDQGEFHALLGQSFRGCESDARRSACDNCHFVFKIHKTTLNLVFSTLEGFAVP